MKKLKLLLFVLIISSTSINCGYSTRSTLDTNIKTIHILEFENKVSYTADSSSRNLYIPLLEVDIRQGVIDRFLFDGNLKIAEEDLSDLVLKGQLINYDRKPLRYTDGDDVEEYRVYIRTTLELIDSGSGEVVWRESNFVGEATYFSTGPLAKSETLAIEEAVSDLARRIVERTIEAW